MNNIYVFDMGHVILRPSDLKGMFEEMETNCDYQTFKKLFYNSEYSNLVYSGKINDELFFGLIKIETGSKKTVKELKDLYIKYKGNLYEETIDIINKLKENNNIVCLLSNLKVIDYMYLRSIMDMNVFDRVYLSYNMGCAKPDIKIYQKVIDDLGTNKFYFFDDSMKNVNSALSLGIDAVNVTGENIKNYFSKKLILK